MKKKANNKRKRVVLNWLPRKKTHYALIVSSFSLGCLSSTESCPCFTWEIYHLQLHLRSIFLCQIKHNGDKWQMMNAQGTDIVFLSYCMHWKEETHSDLGLWLINHAWCRKSGAVAVHVTTLRHIHLSAAWLQWWRCLCVQGSRSPGSIILLHSQFYYK